jgi:hypothetical protein
MCFLINWTGARHVMRLDDQAESGRLAARALAIQGDDNSAAPATLLPRQPRGRPWSRSYAWPGRGGRKLKGERLAAQPREVRVGVVLERHREVVAESLERLLRRGAAALSRRRPMAARNSRAPFSTTPGSLSTTPSARIFKPARNSRPGHLRGCSSGGFGREARAERASRARAARCCRCPSRKIPADNSPTATLSEIRDLTLSKMTSLDQKL